MSTESTFPFSYWAAGGDAESPTATLKTSEGLSQRDYFAILIMNGILSSGIIRMDTVDVAFKLADEFMKASKQ